MEKPDWYSRAAWLMIILAFVLLLGYYFLNEVNQCTSDPLNYYVEKFKSEWGGTYDISGSVSVVGPEGWILIPFGDTENKSIIYTNFSEEKE